jgi:hypothetical protein
VGAESKQTPPDGAPVDEFDEEAEPTTSGLALKPKPPVIDDDDDEEAEERTELQMDAELLARARHRLMFGRAKSSKDAAPSAPEPAAAEVPRPATAGPGVPRKIPTSPAIGSPNAGPPRPAPGGPGPLLSPNAAAPGLPRRLPTPPPGSIQSPYSAGPGLPSRGPTPSPAPIPCAAAAALRGPAGPALPGRPRSATMIGTGPVAAPGFAPRAPTPTPRPAGSGTGYAPAPLATAVAAEAPPSRHAVPTDSGLVPASAAQAGGDAAGGDDDFDIAPQTTELPVPSAGESTDLLGGISALSSDAAITEENPAAPSVDVPTALAPDPDAASSAATSTEPQAPVAPAPMVVDAWSQPGASISRPDGRTGNTGVTGTRRRGKRAPIEYVAISVAAIAVLWASWLVLFYHR